MVTQQRAQELISQARAREIQQQAMALGGDWYKNLHRVLTSKEQATLLAYWKALPSEATIQDAFGNFLEGTAGELG